MLGVVFMKVRQSNYELMRIVSMLFIVIYHIIIHGNLYFHTNGILNLILTFILCITLVHVNSFILLTGFYNYDKQFSLKKFLKTFNASWFYQIFFIIVVLFLGLDLIKNNYELINSISPLNRSYWFVTCYLALYILSPYLNRLIANLNQKEHRNLLIILLLLFSVIPFITHNSLIDNNGFTVVQFCLLYFIGAYLGKYPIRENIHFKNYSKNKFQLVMFSIFALCVILNFCSVELYHYFFDLNKQVTVDLANTLLEILWTYSVPLVILSSIFYFLWFGTFSIKNKFINLIGSLTLGVYLIHDNHFVREVLYKWTGISTGDIVTNYSIIVKIFLLAFIIFIVCALIEFIRQKIFKFCSNRKIVKKLSDKFYNYLKNF